MFDVSSMLQDRGHQVIPFTMKHERNVPTKYSKYFVENIDFNSEIKSSIFRKIKMGFKVIYSFEARNKLLRLIEKENPDIAHIHKFNNSLTPSILYALKKKDIPVVQTLHDYRMVCPNYSLYDFNNSEVCEDCKGHNYFNAVRRRCHEIGTSYLVGLNIAVESYLYHFLKTYENTIDLFIAPSNFLMKKMIEFGVDKNKIIHISNFVYYEKFTPEYNNSNYILYFGRIEKYKGVKTLIYAMRYVRSSKLYVVGEGTYKNELEEYIKKYQIKNVLFLGFKTGKELKEVIKNSIFTVVPSEGYESFGLVVLESFASGKPVIASRLGGLAELIEDNIDGLLFEPGNIEDLSDKMNILLANRNIVVRMGRNARKKIEEKYNENEHYMRLMEAYSRVI
ncbi:glycosyltransferase family 4 protein [candidate division WOR-3 bacterium]|nr:glycosyltransferase family 4 protein [candidate division WOR-3 bacterium]